MTYFSLAKCSSIAIIVFGIVLSPTATAQSSLIKTEAAISNKLKFDFRQRSCQIKTKKELFRAFDFFYSLHLLNGYYRQCSKPLEQDLKSLSLDKFEFLGMLRNSEEPIKACITDSLAEQNVFVNSPSHINKIAFNSGCDDAGYRSALDLLGRAIRGQTEVNSDNSAAFKSNEKATTILPAYPTKSTAPSNITSITEYRYSEASMQGGMTLKALTDGRVAVEINTVSSHGNVCNFTGYGKLKDGKLAAKSDDSDISIDIHIGKNTAKVIDRAEHAEFCGVNAYFSGNYDLRTTQAINSLPPSSSTPNQNSILNQSIADLISHCKPVDESLFKFSVSSPKNPLKGTDYRYLELQVEGYVGADSDAVSIYGWRFKGSEELIKEQLQLKPIKGRVKFDQAQKRPYDAILKWQFNKSTGTTDVFCEVKY